MTWTRLGTIYVPDGSRPWSRSHASLPVPVQIDVDLFRFFFSTRDEESRSHVGWVDVDLSDRPQVVREAPAPALAPGEDGTFDDSGVGVGCLTPSDTGHRLYYMGWNLGTRSPWRNSIGLAEAGPSLDRFARFSPGPIIDRSPENPYTFSYPCVVRKGPDDWWMWYGSNLGPGLSNTNLRHVLKLARSADGLKWYCDKRTILGFANADEYVVARPTVVRIAGRFLMGLACRGPYYRIGAAWSDDGIKWTRIDDSMGLDRSREGWDSEMACYPALFVHRERLWLAYNGNEFGKTGFGLARWDDERPLEDVMASPTM
jgi:hypothetical protein